MRFFRNPVRSDRCRDLLISAYVCAEDEEVSSDPERADLLILPVLVREESILPFFRLLHVCLNLKLK